MKQACAQRDLIRYRVAMALLWIFPVVSSAWIGRREHLVE